MINHVCEGIFFNIDLGIHTAITVANISIYALATTLSFAGLLGVLSLSWMSVLNKRGSVEVQLVVPSEILR